MCKSSRQAVRSKAITELAFHVDKLRFLGSKSCWEWPKYRNEKGYGVIFCDGLKFSVHRLSFEFFKGKIPKRHHVMHECDNPPCFNPDHLFLGTHQENMDDMVRKGRSRRRAA